MNHPDPASGDGFARLGPAILRWSLFAACAYLIVVFGYRQRVAGISMGGLTTGAALVVALVATRLFVHTDLITKLTFQHSFEFALALGTTVGAVLIADVAFGVITNIEASRAASENESTSVRRDAQVWQPELIPHMFVPKGTSFHLYKPGEMDESWAYGWMYQPGMLASRTLTDSVLERRRIRYQIGPAGLREEKPLTACRVFALGDSFVFGYDVNAADAWPERLGAALGRPVCNLGISGAGPRSEAELMQYLVKTQPDLCVKQLLWMVYEGNDLESDDTAAMDGAETYGLGSALTGTVLQALVDLPGLVQEESVLRKLVNHELSLSRSAHEMGGMRVVNGVTLRDPLFRSDALGLKLFYQLLIERSQQGSSYVQTHPRRGIIERAFRDMKTLASQANFDVTIIIAPTDVRLYAAEFHDFPPIGEPHVIDWFVTLAQSNGFHVVNLLPMLAPLAKHELLYHRDDTHFNPRGHEIVAQLLARTLSVELAEATGASPSPSVRGSNSQTVIGSRRAAASCHGGTRSPLNDSRHPRSD